MFEFELISIWEPQKPQGTYINFHSHDYHELVYYAQGNGKTVIDGDTYTFKEGNFCIIPPRVFHDELHFIDSHIFCLKFHTSCEFSPGFHTDTDYKVLDFLKKIMAETKEQKYGYKNMITARLTELCVHILRNENTDATEKNFEYVINYIKENYGDKIVLRDCADMLNYNYDYFQHKFKRLTGLSPQRFLLNRRLQAAKELLRDKDILCTDIALACGFSTSAQFSALFKREYGISPKQYQKSLIQDKK